MFTESRRIITTFLGWHVLPITHAEPSYQNVQSGRRYTSNSLQDLNDLELIYLIATYMVERIIPRFSFEKTKQKQVKLLGCQFPRKNYHKLFIHTNKRFHY
jgi:hypothetical protein